MASDATPTLKTNTPTSLWFSQQDSYCIWDDEEVLDKTENYLKEQDYSVKRHPKTEHYFGHLDIHCSTETLALKIKKAHAGIRGQV